MTAEIIIAKVRPMLEDAFTDGACGGGVTIGWFITGACGVAGC